MNKIVVGDLLTISSKKYIVMDKIFYVDSDYVFVNEITSDEDNTDNYYVMRLEDDNVEIISDKNLVNSLLPIFSDNIQMMVNRVFE